MQTVATTSVFRKQSLIANVIRACKCGAPGYWHDTPGVNIACYAPEKVTQIGSDAVGNVCPACGASRQAVEGKGVIWSRQWRVSLWTVLKDTFRDIFRIRKTT